MRARKRSQASKIINDLRMIDAAVDQYAIESGKKTGDTAVFADWQKYLKKNSNLYVTGNGPVRQHLRRPNRRYLA